MELINQAIASANQMQHMKDSIPKSYLEVEKQVSVAR